MCKRRLMHLQKSIDAGHPAPSAQADLSRYILRLVTLLRIKGVRYMMIHLVTVQNRLCAFVMMLLPAIYNTGSSFSYSMPSVNFDVARIVEVFFGRISFWER